MDRRSFLAAGSAALLAACAARRGPALATRPLTWAKLPTLPYRGKQDDIAFADPANGWYGNGEGLLYRTLDGGDSWTEIWRRPGTYIRALGFLDARTGILGNVGAGVYPPGTDTVPLYRTVDGGATWAPVRIDGPAPAGICGIDVVRGAAPVLHAAGRVGGPAHYLQSHDGGSSWRSSDLSTLASAIFDVKFLGRRTGFLAAAQGADQAAMRGTILRTDDGGASWREVFRTARGFETVWKLHFPTRDTGYATIQSYDPDPANVRRFIARSVDGGASWSELPLIDARDWRSFGIGFADEAVGWVGGTTGGLETRDGGLSWTPVEMGRAVNKIRIVGAGGRRRAYAIGSDVYRLDLG